jgi:urease accessory protein
VALVQSRASLLAGDELAMTIQVGQGATLELEEIGATVAYDCRGGEPTRVAINIEVADGGRLVWLSQPLVVADGARATRTTNAELHGSGRLLIGETVVLGRAGETGGELNARTRITINGAPAVDERLAAGHATPLRSAVVAADATVIAALTLAGVRAAAPPAGTLQAHLPASLWRLTGTAVAVERAAAPVRLCWRAQLTG